MTNIHSAQDDVSDVRWSRCQGDSVSFAWFMDKELGAGSGRNGGKDDDKDDGEWHRGTASVRPDERSECGESGCRPKKKQPARWAFHLEGKLVRRGDAGRSPGHRESLGRPTWGDIEDGLPPLRRPSPRPHEDWDEDEDEDKEWEQDWYN